MKDAQTNLQEAAVEFLEAVNTLAAKAAEQADPLDEVSTDLFELGDLEPAIGREELSVLKRRLRHEELAPHAIMELVSLARQVAAVLTE